MRLTIGGDDECTGCRHRSRLATRRGAQVDDALAGASVDELRHPLRRAILNVAVVAHRDRRRFVHPRQRGERVIVPELGRQPRHEPVGVAESSGVIRPARLTGGGDAPQHGIDDGPQPRRGDRDRLAHRGMSRDVREQHLVGTEAQQRAQLGRWRLGQEPIDGEVARSAHARRAVDQLGDEAAVTLDDTRDESRRDQVGIGAIVVDAAQRVVGGGARRPRRVRDLSVLGLSCRGSTSLVGHRASAPERIVSTRSGTVSPGVDGHRRLALGLHLYKR